MYKIKMSELRRSEKEKKFVETLKSVRVPSHKNTEMETDYVNENESLPIGTYKQMMSNIEFMQSYLEEPDIFKPDSETFKNFLIESFCSLYFDFDYLFFERKDIDAKIVKASHILQILPETPEKIPKLFDNMSRDDIHEFWLKFFALFTWQSGDSIKSPSKTSLEEKISFFKDMKSTVDYIEYEIPTSPAEELSSGDASREIESWAELPVSSTQTACERVTLFNSDEEGRNSIDIGKLKGSLKQVMSTYDSIKNPPHQQNNAERVDFFCNLINLAETMSQYQNNLNVVSCPVLDESNFKMLSGDKDFSENLNYIKRCNDFQRRLKSKIMSVKQV